MSRFVKQSHFWRVAVLLMLLVAVAGPWTYEDAYVSPGFSCTWPNSPRPEGHLYCGMPVSGLWNIFLLLPLAVSVLRGEVNLSQWAGPAVFLLLTMSLVAPVLLLAVRRNARPLLFALTWVLAAIAGVGFLSRGYYEPYAPPWGNLLFIAVATVALLSELVFNRAGVIGRRRTSA